MSGSEKVSLHGFLSPKFRNILFNEFLEKDERISAPK
jgi:hypothetical protein